MGTLLIASAKTRSAPQRWWPASLNDYAASDRGVRADCNSTTPKTRGRSAWNILAAGRGSAATERSRYLVVVARRVAGVWLGGWTAERLDREIGDHTNPGR